MAHGLWRLPLSQGSELGGGRAHHQFISVPPVPGGWEGSRKCGKMSAQMSLWEGGTGYFFGGEKARGHLGKAAEDSGRDR